MPPAVDSYVLVDGPEILEAVKGTSQARFVAVSGLATLALEDAGVAFISLDQHTPPSEIIDLGWRNYEALDGFCDPLDQLLRNRLPKIARADLRPMRDSFYFAKICMDSLSSKILMLQRFLAAEPPAGSLVYRAQPPLDGVDRIPAFDNATNLFARILDSLDLASGMERRPLALGGPRVAAHGRGFLRHCLRQARDHLKARGRERFLLFSPGHDIDLLLPRLAAHGVMPMRPARPWRHGPALSDDWIKDLAAIGGNEAFSVGGLSYLPVMTEIFFRPLARQLSAALACHGAVRRQLARRPARFALTGTLCCGLMERSAMRTATQAGIPLVTYQEGAGYGTTITPIYDYTEMRAGDALLAYGQGVAEYYAEQGNTGKPILAVGSARQDAVARRLVGPARPPGGRRLLYVGSMANLNCNHFPNSASHEQHYFSVQRAILDGLNGLPEDFLLTARLHPGDVIARKLLARPQYRRYTLEERSFEEVAGEADIIVIDAATTTLMTACLTRARLLVLLEPGVTALTKAQSDRLATRADVFGDLNGLLAAIAALPGRSDPIAEGRDYVRAYVTHLDDGRSAGRAVAALLGRAWERPRA